MGRRVGYAVAVLVAMMLSGISAKDATPVFDPGNFDSPAENTYMPKTIGSTYVYEAETEDGLVHNEITFTSDTKTILGILCTVVQDVEWVFVEGTGFVKTEETDDWHAWDNDGNVWYFGEDTVEYLYDDDWNLIGTSTEGSWEAGVDGAEPGVVMLAEPRPGNSYRQEYYEGVAEDMGKVLRDNASVPLPLDDFTDCLVTKEWTPLSPGEIEHKYYAPNVGLVYIEELKGKTVHVELIEIR